MSEQSKLWVVDDDKEDQMMLSEYFEEIEMADRVEYFDNGKTALTELDRVEDSKLPKLIVLDLNMPILSGSQTLLEIKRNTRFKNIAVVVFTTAENDEEKRKCFSFGAQDYVVKPMSFDEGRSIAERFVQYLK